MVEEFKNSRLVKTFRTDSIQAMKSRIHSLRYGVTVIASRLGEIQKSLKNSEMAKKQKRAQSCYELLLDAVSTLMSPFLF